MAAERAADDDVRRLIRFLIDSLEESRDFVVEQAPDVLQQWVTYQRACYTGMAVLLLAGIMLFVWAVRNASERYKKASAAGKSEEADARPFLVFVCCAIGLGGGLGACLWHLTKLWLAPKVAILEWLTSFLK